MPRCAEFHTQKWRGAKASPGGEAGATLVATDEVEATNHRHEIARRCYPRPHPVRLRPDHRSSGMTATGSHIDFGFAARSTTLQGKALVCASPKAPTAPHPSRLWRATFPQGKAFLCPSGLLHRICRSGIATRRAGHAPPLQCFIGRYAKSAPYRSMGRVVFYLALTSRRRPSKSCPKRNRHPG